jgi:hypothetical protein
LTQFQQEFNIENDPFLNSFIQRQKTILLSAFTQQIRNRKFNKQPGNPLASKTVQIAVDDISKTFRDFDKEDPQKDRDRLTSMLLQKQYQGYKNLDLPECHQNAIPLSVIRKQYNIYNNPIEQALAEINTDTFYFTMRSCEYCNIPGYKDKRTKLLCLQNFHFSKIT